TTRPNPSCTAAAGCTCCTLATAATTGVPASCPSHSTTAPPVCAYARVPVVHSGNTHIHACSTLFSKGLQQYNNAYVQMLRANSAQNASGINGIRCAAMTFAFAGVNMEHIRIAFIQRALQQWKCHFEQLKLAQRAQQACAAHLPTTNQHYEGGPRQG